MSHAGFVCHVGQVQDLLLDCCANVNRVARTLQAVAAGAMNQASVMTGRVRHTAAM